jgi:putative lipoic acid-binding regulatory protein
MKKTDSSISEEDSFIEFPCDFPLKVMGSATPEFHQRMIEIASLHDPRFNKNDIKTKQSKTGKYTSLTLSIHAESKGQLDALYQELTDCELVLWAL